ncbi:MAG: TrmO family methyltransferase [Bacteroidota bacterium]
MIKPVKVLQKPFRPNPIGPATLKLEKVENGILYVSGIDAYDGTPVLDIKPYSPSIDGY